MVVSQDQHPTPDPPSLASPGDIIGYTEAADLLHVAVGTVYAWVHQKRVPHYRIGKRCVRFSKSALLAYLTLHAVAADEGGGKP